MGAYLMEMAEDGDKVSAVAALQEIGRESRTTLRPDAIVVASPHWLPKSAFFVDIHTIDPELMREAAPEADGRPLYFLAGVTGNAPGRLVQYQGMKYSVGDATFAFAPSR